MDYFNMIRDTINTIEENINSPISPKELADRAHISQFHFSRIFRAITGYSIAEYARYRKLSCAAERLMAGDQSILSIALQYNFNSQEAFTRAFKKTFRCTPGRYQRGQAKIELHDKKMLWGIRYRANHTNKEIPYEIVELQEIKLFGMQCNTMLRDGINFKDIGRLCGKFEERVRNSGVEDLGRRRRFGVAFPTRKDYKDPLNNAFTYFRGIEVRPSDTIPAHMLTKTIAKCKYAKFISSTDPRKYDATLDYIFGIWLPESQINLAQETIALLEVHKGKRLSDYEWEVEVYVPIQ